MRFSDHDKEIVKEFVLWLYNKYKIFELGEDDNLDEILKEYFDKKEIAAIKHSSTSNKTRYRVVSDRRSYGVYQDFEYAKQYCGDLALQASCYGSSEYFWIEEEGA